MISKEEIKKLAELARIEIGDDEAEKLGGEMDAILEYVGQVKSVSEGVEENTKIQEHRNVFRQDTNPTESGTYSKDLIAEFPKSDKNYLKVKKIL